MVIADALDRGGLVKAVRSVKPARSTGERKKLGEPL